MLKAPTDNYIPDYQIESFYDVTDNFLKMLKDEGIKAILLDVDGTITTHYGTEMTEDAKQFLKTAKEKGFSLAYITNSSFDRSEIISQRFGKYIDYNIFWPDKYCNSIWTEWLLKIQKRKPFRQSYLNAAKELDIDIKHCAMIGDQYSTDIWGAKRAGIKYTIKINNSLSSNEPEKKRLQRIGENWIYNQITRLTKNEPAKIKDILLN